MMREDYRGADILEGSVWRGVEGSDHLLVTAHCSVKCRQLPPLPSLVDAGPHVDERPDDFHSAEACAAGVEQAAVLS